MLILVIVQIVFILNLNTTYEKIHVYQIGWYITNKFPFNDVKYVLNKDRFGNYDLVKSKKDVKVISKELSDAKHIDTLIINDLRLVALLEQGNQIDTLLIDVDGNCKFKNKKFRINDILGKKLKIRNPDYNSKYRYKKRGKISKKALKEWE